MSIQPWLLVEQTAHSTDQAQLTAAAATRGHPTQPRAFISLHAAFEHCGVVGPPIHGYRAPPHNKRDDQQVLVPFDAPVHGQPDWAMSREWDQGLEPHRIRQMARLQPFVVQQPRDALAAAS